jgi:hypothetical protein
MSDKVNAAFEIDPRITLSIDYDLAVSLGMLVLDSSTKNTALLALGHQLRNLSKLVESELRVTKRGRDE